MVTKEQAPKVVHLNRMTTASIRTEAGGLNVSIAKGIFMVDQSVSVAAAREFAAALVEAANAAEGVSA